MQSISIYLVPNKIDAFLNPSADWLTERYRRVYNRNLKIYRGVDNKVDIQVRNSDQKAIEVFNTLVFTLIEKEQQKKVLVKDCIPVSALNGKFYVDLSEDDLDNVEPGFYEYSLTLESRSSNDNGYTVTTRRPLYTDSQYGSAATIEVNGSLRGEPPATVSIREFSKSIDYTAHSETYYSSIIDARPSTSNPQKTHTFQMFFSQYQGTVRIQGSIENSGNPQTWSDIIPAGELDSKFIIESSDTSVYKNIVGKWNWFRVVHTPGKSYAKAEFVVSQTILLDYNVGIRNAGLGYAVGDQIIIQGNILGGESPTNNLVIDVTLVDSQGRILEISWSGTSYNGVRTFVVSGESNTGTFDKILYR